MQPMMGELCTECRHPFGKHYTSNDGSTDGCSHLYPWQEGDRPVVGADTPEHKCMCSGFSMRVRAQRQMTRQEEINAYWDK